MSRSRKNPRKSRNRKRAAQAYRDTPTPAQQRAHDEWVRAEQARWRSVCTGFNFWRACDERSCQRAKACMGDDAEACFNRCWRCVREADKIHFRAAIKARVAGCSVAEACRLADEEVARSADHIARVDAETLARFRAEAEAEIAARHGK
jgi:hypothetical protein